MFHITNGDHANEWLEQAGVEGEFLSWDDVLHEGPVPTGLTLAELSQIRARFISFSGWATEFEALTHFQTRDARLIAAARQGEVVVWNSHELFDQLHLLQILSWYQQEGAGLPAPKLVFVDELLGAGVLGTERLQQLLEQAQPATAEQIACADDLWQLFTSSNPRGLAGATKQPITQFPFMQQGLQRMVEEYPDSQGLSRTERSILQGVIAGHDTPAELFRYVRDLEAIPFMGDASFWQIINGMFNSAQPLLRRIDGQSFELPDLYNLSESFRAQQLALTADAEILLSGQGNWLDQHQIDRWVGGVHLNPENRWLWDGADFTRY